MEKSKLICIRKGARVLQGHAACGSSPEFPFLVACLTGNMSRTGMHHNKYACRSAWRSVLQQAVKDTHVVLTA